MGQIVSDVTSVINGKKENKQLSNQRQQVLDQMARDEKQKNNLIKKALAKQRASYGAGGMSGRGMTEEAVLNRLRDETSAPFVDKKITNLDKIAALKKSKPGAGLLKSFLSNFDKLLG